MSEDSKRRFDILCLKFPHVDKFLLEVEAEPYLGSDEKFSKFLKNYSAAAPPEPSDTSSISSYGSCDSRLNSPTRKLLATDMMMFSDEEEGGSKQNGSGMNLDGPDVMDSISKYLVSKLIRTESKESKIPAEKSITKEVSTNGKNNDLTAEKGKTKLKFEETLAKELQGSAELSSLLNLDLGVRNKEKQNLTQDKKTSDIQTDFLLKDFLYNNLPGHDLNSAQQKALTDKLTALQEKVQTNKTDGDYELALLLARKEAGQSPVLLEKCPSSAQDGEVTPFVFGNNQYQLNSQFSKLAAQFPQKSNTGHSFPSSVQDRVSTTYANQKPVGPDLAKQAKSEDEEAMSRELFEYFNKTTSGTPEKTSPHPGQPNKGLGLSGSGRDRRLEESEADTEITQPSAQDKKMNIELADYEKQYEESIGLSYYGKQNQESKGLSSYEKQYEESKGLSYYGKQNQESKGLSSYEKQHQESKGLSSYEKQNQESKGLSYYEKRGALPKNFLPAQETDHSVTKSFVCATKNQGGFFYHVEEPQKRGSDFFLPAGMYYVVPDNMPISATKGVPNYTESQLRAFYNAPAPSEVAHNYQTSGSQRCEQYSPKTSFEQPKSYGTEFPPLREPGKSAQIQNFERKSFPTDEYESNNVARYSSLKKIADDFAKSGYAVSRSSTVDSNLTITKGEKVKLNIAPARGVSQVFCNAPLQTLQRDKEEDVTPTAPSTGPFNYGRVLASLAGKQSSQSKTNDRLVGASAAENRNKTKNLLFENMETEDDAALRKHVDTQKMPMGRSVSLTKEEAMNVAIEEQYSNMLNLFPSADTMYLRRKVEECAGDVEKYGQLVDAELQRQQDEAEQREKVRLEVEYLHLVQKLPQCDTEYVRRKWEMMIGDAGKQEAFVEEEDLKAQINDLYMRLLQELPSSDPSFLKRKAEDLYGDEDHIELFLNEEKEKTQVEEQYRRMLEALPSKDPAELHRKCREFQGVSQLVEEYINESVAEITEQVQRDEVMAALDHQLAEASEILPEADPEFLKTKWEECNGDVELYNQVIFGLLDSKDYPKLPELNPADRERVALWHRHIESFNVMDYLSTVPSPEERFSNAPSSQGDQVVALKFLQSRYPRVAVEELQRQYADQGSLLKTCDALDNSQKPIEIIDILLKTEKYSDSFLLEMVYIIHRREVRTVLRVEQETRDLQLQEARLRNELLTCGCCYDDEVLRVDMVQCPEGHVFCKSCLIKSCETQLSDSKTTLPCLSGCDQEFTLVTLERVLPGNVYRKLLQTRQVDEITKAQVPGLEGCPFCDFVYIPPPDDKVFKCQNTTCGKESCRLCREPSHVPLRCEEVERPRDVQVRTRIEEQMTAALVRCCPKCNKKVIKEDGCNKMTCPCGTWFCYICRNVVTDYCHFNGQGGSNHHLCPLWSNNEELHVTAVRAAGTRARDREMRDNPDVRMVYDPTSDM